MKTFQLQDAKARFSEIVAKVSAEGPFVITVHGAKKAALVSIEQYEGLNPSAKEPLLDFFRRSPLRGLDLPLERDKSPMRKVAI